MDIREAVRDIGPTPDHPLYKEARKLRDNGWKIHAIAKELDTSATTVVRVLGPTDRRTKTKGKYRSLYMRQSVFDAASDAAKKLGLTAQKGRYPDNGSISLLFDTIASGEVECIKADDPKPYSGASIKALPRNRSFNLSLETWDKLGDVASRLGLDMDWNKYPSTAPTMALLFAIHSGKVVCRWQDERDRHRKRVSKAHPGK